ncbi:hypothetical protein QBE52_13790 [Clostridiaceae bacterium 35-E11]
MKKDDQFENLFFQIVWRIEHLRHLAFLSSSSVQRQSYEKLIKNEMNRLVQLNIELWEKERGYIQQTIKNSD